MVNLWCDICGDLTMFVKPCKFSFNEVDDEIILELYICLKCMDKGKINIDLNHKVKVEKIKKKLMEL